MMTRSPNTAAIVLIFISLIAASVWSAPAPADFDGIWIARFPSPTGFLVRLVVSIDTRSGAEAKVTAASPDQGFADLPVTEIAIEADARQIRFGLPAFGARFTGTLGEGSEPQIAGALEASGMRLPLTFERADTAPQVVERPQTPRPPFPYRVEAVTYEGADGVRLAGTLTVPPGPGPHPAAVLLGVALPDDRDGTFANHRFYAVLADALTRRGVAVLRSDDRGVGESGGDYFQATYGDFAADARSARALVVSRPEVDAERVGFIGWSEGTAISALAAAGEPDVAFLVLLGGLGQAAREALPEQAAAMARAAGAPSALIADRRQRAEELIEVVTSASDPSARRAQVEALAASDRLSSTGAVSFRPGMPSTVDLFASPWYRSQFGYDPAETLARSRCPVIAITGALDRVLPPRENLAGFQAALSATEGRDVSIVQLPGLNHLMQPARTGLPIEYASLAVTVSPLLLATVGDWIVARMAPRAAVEP